MSRILLISILIFTSLIILASEIKKLNFQNTQWLKSDNIYEINRNELINDFNETEKLNISFHLNQNFLNNQTKDQIIQLTQAIEDLAFVDSIITPYNAAYLINNGNNSQNISLEYAIKNEIITFDEAPNILNQSFYQNILFNEDLTKFNIVITPLFNDIRVKVRNDLIQSIENLINQTELLNMSYYITGKTFLYQQLDKKNHQNIYQISIITLALSLLFIAFIFREKFRFLITGLNTISAILINVFLFNLFEINFSLLSLSLPVIAVIVNISDTIFIFNKYNHNYINNKLELYKTLVKKSYKPCLITSLTTCFAFLSYIFSDIKPLFDIYYLATIAILLNFLWVIFITPYLLIISKAPIIQDQDFIKKLLNRIYQFANKTNFKFVQLICIFILITSPAIFFIKSETNFLNIFFFKHENIYQNIQRFDKEFIGSSDLTLIINSNSQDNFKTVDFYNKLTELTHNINDIENINSSRSYQNIAKDALTKLADQQKQFKTDFELEQILLFLEFSRSETSHDVLADYINFDYSKGRVKFYTDNLTSYEIKKLKESINHNIEQKHLANHNLTGTNIYFDGIANYLINTQIYSLFFILFMIFIAICYFYNIKAAILTSIANLIPLISLISLSSIFQINFDFSFVLVTVICFGITVDCAIHIINDHYLNHDLKANILKTGAAVTEISLFFIIAFISFLFSDLLIFVKFGILAIIAITISYFVNMVLLPITIRKYLN